MERYLTIAFVLLIFGAASGYFTWSIVTTFSRKSYFTCGTSIAGFVYILTLLVKFAITY